METGGIEHAEQFSMTNETKVLSTDRKAGANE